MNAASDSLTASADLFGHLIGTVFQMVGVFVCFALAVLVLLLAWRIYAAGRAQAQRAERETLRAGRMRAGAKEHAWRRA